MIFVIKIDFFLQKSIFKMLEEVFLSATSKPPPIGIGHNPQSRAMYAVDIMLQWNKGMLKFNVIIDTLF